MFVCARQRERERERVLLAGFVGVGRTGVVRKGKAAYLLIYSSDTYLHNTYHSLSPFKRIAHFRIINLSLTVALHCRKGSSPQIHDELLILPLNFSLFFFLCSFVLPLDPIQTPETRVVENVSTNSFLTSVLFLLRMYMWTKRQLKLLLIFI